MKKVLAFVLVLLMSVALVACEGNKDTSSKAAGTSTATSKTTSTATSKTESKTESAVVSEAESVADESPAVSA